MSYHCSGIDIKVTAEPTIEAETYGGIEQTDTLTPLPSRKQYSVILNSVRQPSDLGLNPNNPNKKSGMHLGSRNILGGSKMSSLAHNKLFSAIEHAVGEDTCKYEEVTQEYLEERGLEPESVPEWSMYAYFLGLILCLGCSNAWNSALGWGYGPVFISALIAGIAYTCLVTILAEMMTIAFGPYVGYLIGTCEAWEYTLFGAQAVWQSGLVLANAFSVDFNFAPLFWLLTVGLVAACHFAGTKWLMGLIGITLTINISAMIILILPSLKTLDPWNNALFAAKGFTNPITGEAFNYTDPITGNDKTDLYTYMFPFGSVGIFQCIPTLMWTFLGIEAAPLCCEESVGFIKNSPRIALKAQITMWSLVLFTMIIVPMLSPGIGDPTFTSALDPLVKVFQGSYGIADNSVAYNALYCCLFLPNLILAIACYSYACSRQVYGLSHIGYYNKKLSITWQKTKVPIGAVIMTLSFFMLVAASGVVLLALLNGSLLYGMFAYVGTALAYIKLKIFMPHVKRPFDAGFYVGIFSALFLIGCCITAMTQMFATVTFRETLFVCLGKIMLQFSEFIFFRRHHMVQTPEEQFIHAELHAGGVDVAMSTGELADGSKYMVNANGRASASLRSLKKIGSKSGHQINVIKTVDESMEK
ncbi:hypothetical protein BCR33DRAFT_710989 [Rhizoclosmatium globosum]|uniref:Amino acid permease/ SLC12A domain-containing protein n=1 Tax=Rhizoclosmatium globosum TaxID=329046 RepID=A0A1Y2D4T0_9FUNG|nr:hypothetical protein BCR33DRAFT_710989 [Rhizoclosmatium globosum]|eukprot:ORY53595.1 hypothetical protein BCR33DRAFT_710989 [Rhizoclosmatium globosum]